MDNVGFVMWQLNFFVISVSKQECERLLQLYKEFVQKSEAKTFKGRSGIDRHKFRDILHQHFHMTDDVLMDKGGFI